MSTTSKLIFDIETIGVDFDSLDKTTQESLTRWIKKESASEIEYQEALEELKSGLGFSPLTGEIVAIGVLDYNKNQGVVYFQAPNHILVKEKTPDGKELISLKEEKAAQSRTERSSGAGQAPGQKIEEFIENNIKFKQMTEKEMLESFWQGASQYLEFITFNGRVFDVPFLMVRSAVHDIKPTKNLMEGRYLYQQRTCRHIDLQDQLTFYGTTRKKGDLHLWSNVFGIKSPKASGITGDDIGRLFKEKKYLEIARYNVGDLIATKELYDKWGKYFNL